MGTSLEDNAESDVHCEPRVCVDPTRTREVYRVSPKDTPTTVTLDEPVEVAAIVLARVSRTIVRTVVLFS